MAIVLVRNKVSPARWAAFEILQKVEAGVFSSVLLAADDHRLEPHDRGLCHELVLGVLRWQFYLDKIIEHYSNRKIKSLDPAVAIALRLGLYQLRFLKRIPASAAVNESVKLVEAVRLSSARAFVNAILRRAGREPDYDPAESISDPIERIAVATSHPLWLIERWANSFGLEEAEKFARANNEIPAVAFRIVKSKADESDILAKLSMAGLTVEQSAVAANAWRTSSGSPLLRALADTGQIYLQDEASQLVAETVAALGGQCVLDLCSAPGGKTTLIAERTGALVVASDISARRLDTVIKSVAGQQLERVSPMLLNASRSLPFQPGSFDTVLVDAPCSGTGTLRHNPEIRWRITGKDIAGLAYQQVHFLTNAAKVVKRGGHLVYSTCSVETEENEDVIGRFLEITEKFKPAGTVRTWPHRDGTDGFFMTVFERD